jgi:hypothetical protein
VNVNNLEDYYKISIFIPLLDRIISELRIPLYQRFREIISIKSLIPLFIIKYDNTTFLGTVKIHENNHPLDVVVTFKLFVWQN